MFQTLCRSCKFWSCRSLASLLKMFARPPWLGEEMITLEPTTTFHLLNGSSIEERIFLFSLPPMKFSNSRSCHWVRFQSIKSGRWQGPFWALKHSILCFKNKIHYENYIAGLLSILTGHITNLADIHGWRLTERLTCLTVDNFGNYTINTFFSGTKSGFLKNFRDQFGQLV